MYVQQVTDSRRKTRVGLTAAGLTKLLSKLDNDADKYEALRLKLCRFFVWRGCSSVHADELADESFDRIAAKLVEGVEVENVSAYVLQIARYVWLEFSRKYKEDNFGGEMPVQIVQPNFNDGADERIVCLRKCVREIAPDETDRKLLIGYYDSTDGDKIKNQRKKLAEKFGIKLNTLKVKMFRLREKLEDCIKDCLSEE